LPRIRRAISSLTASCSASTKRSMASSLRSASLIRAVAAAVVALCRLSHFRGQGGGQADCPGHGQQPHQ
jgi:hypothetical protein